MTFSNFPSSGVALQGGGGSGGAGASAPLTGTGATVTTSQPLIDVLQTWNNAAVTFTGMRFNAAGTSSTNSAAASLLMDLQVGGTSQFSVGKAGGVTGSSFRQTSSGAGIQVNANSSRLLLHSNNAELAYGDGSSLTLGATILLNWSPSAPSSGSSDTTLRRRAAANLALGAADAAGSATVTITIATPGVVTWSNHGLSTGTPVIFTTTGALPTGITAGTTYYAIVVDTNTIRIATSLANALAGTAVNTSGSQSGTQTGSRGAITQTWSVQSVVAGTTNFPGADKIITGSQGTGSGAGGSLIFQVAPAGSSGSAQNALQNVFLLPGASGEARLVNSAGGSADFKICSTSNTNVHLTIKHGTDASGASGTTTGFIGRISSSFGFFDGGGSLIFGQPSGSTDSISIWGTDCRIARDDANKLALRNGTAAQEFRVYETTTGTIYKAILGNRQLMKIAGAAFDNGAGANAGTLANSPVTGNPTKWIPIDDNGTTRYIPAW